MLGLGWLLVVLGLAITPLPIPVGLIMVLFGLAILTLKSDSLRAFLRARRQRYRRLSAKLTGITPKLPKLLRRAVELTDPDRKPDSNSDFK